MEKPASSFDEIPGGIGEFGREVSNPIPVSGIAESSVYLARLRTSDGDPISWRRQGSIRSENITGILDKYQIWNAWTGDDLGFLYISPYNDVISGQAPQGLLLLGVGRSVPDHTLGVAFTMEKLPEIYMILKDTFGLDLPLSGGNGQSIDDAITINVRDGVRAEKIENKILECIHRLGNKEWQIERTQVLEHKGRRIRKTSVVLSDDPANYRNFYFDVTDYD